MTRTFVVRDGVGIAVGIGFLIAAGILGFVPLRPNAATPFLNATYPLVPVLVAVLGVWWTARSVLGVPLVVNSAGLLTIHKRTWLLRTAIIDMVPVASVDRVAVVPHARRRKGRTKAPTWGLELIVRTDGVERRIPISDGSSSGHSAKVARAQRIEAFLRDQASGRSQPTTGG